MRNIIADMQRYRLVHSKYVIFGMPERSVSSHLMWFQASPFVNKMRQHWRIEFMGYYKFFVQPRTEWRCSPFVEQGDMLVTDSIIERMAQSTYEAVRECLVAK